MAAVEAGSLNQETGMRAELMVVMNVESEVRGARPRRKGVECFSANKAEDKNSNGDCKDAPGARMMPQQRLRRNARSR